MEPQKQTFQEKQPKKWKSITILHLMTAFHNVGLKIETSFKLQSCFMPKLIFLVYGQDRKNVGLIGWENENNIIWFLGSIYF